MKKFVLLLLCVAICASMVACGGGNDQPAATETNVIGKEIPLTDEEKEIIELMGDDVLPVSDDEYISVISEIIHHTSQYVGRVYQVEGILTVDGENVTLHRNLVHGKETAVLGLPVRYLTKEIESGSWVRLTAIVAEAEVNGQMMSVLDVVAIEGLAKVGMADMEWDGNSTHQH